MEKLYNESLIKTVESCERRKLCVLKYYKGTLTYEQPWYKFGKKKTEEKTVLVSLTEIPEWLDEKIAEYKGKDVTYTFEFKCDGDSTYYYMYAYAYVDGKKVDTEYEMVDFMELSDEYSDYEKFCVVSNEHAIEADMGLIEKIKKFVADKYVSSGFNTDFIELPVESLTVKEGDTLNTLYDMAAYIKPRVRAIMPDDTCMYKFFDGIEEADDYAETYKDKGFVEKPDDSLWGTYFNSVY